MKECGGQLHAQRQAQSSVQLAFDNCHQINQNLQPKVFKVYEFVCDKSCRAVRCSATDATLILSAIEPHDHTSPNIQGGIEAKENGSSCVPEAKGWLLPASMQVLVQLLPQRSLGISSCSAGRRCTFVVRVRVCDVPPVRFCFACHSFWGPPSPSLLLWLCLCGWLTGWLCTVHEGMGSCQL